jgi:hypothetical protein
MARGLQALGPLGLWESLAGSVLFPGHDHYYFSTHCYSCNSVAIKAGTPGNPHSLM